MTSFTSRHHEDRQIADAMVGTCAQAKRINGGNDNAIAIVGRPEPTQPKGLV